jgi:hypothetical protein
VATTSVAATPADAGRAAVAAGVAAAGFADAAPLAGTPGFAALTTGGGTTGFGTTGGGTTGFGTTGGGTTGFGTTGGGAAREFGWLPPGSVGVVAFAGGCGLCSAVSRLVAKPGAPLLPGDGTVAAGGSNEDV